MPSFAVERTLGRLARWLRIMGFDAVCESDATRPEYPGGKDEGRVRLTRIVTVAGQGADGPRLLIRSDHLPEQLREVVQALHIDLSDVRLFSRCLKCNRPIAAIDKGQVRSRVPDYVWENQDQFSQCPKCRQIYWPGTHAARSLNFIKQVFGDQQSPRFE